LAFDRLLEIILSSSHWNCSVRIAYSLRSVHDGRTVSQLRSERRRLFNKLKEQVIVAYQEVPNWCICCLGCGALSLDGWSLIFSDSIVVSSARVKMFMEKYEEVCMDILTPEDETKTLSQNNGHQSLNDLPPHPRLQLHHCQSIKAPTITQSVYLYC